MGSLISALCLSGCSKKEDSKKEGSEMDGIISNMKMDEKIYQMIIPAIRT
jgi:beta-N-acetylhexosaminidase